MANSKDAVIMAVISIVLPWNKILVSALYFSPYRFHNSPFGSSSRNSFCFRNRIRDDSEDHDIAKVGSMHGYTILRADSREKVFAIKLYRFGGPNIDEHMKSNQDLISRQEAIQSLTPTFDDRGTQKVFYSDGVFGESLQFFAQADDISAFVSNEVRDDENAKLSLTQTPYGVLGSVEAVVEYAREGNGTKEILIELKNLSVHTNARRLGIGKALTEAVQEYARHQVSILEQKESERYTGVVHLTVELENKGAMRLYKETGFDLKGEEDELCTFTWTTKGESMTSKW